MVEVITGKVISAMIVENEFAQCDSIAQLKNEPELRDCLRNY